MQRSETQSISISVPPPVVFELVADPHRLPDWAPDFARTIRPDGDEWIVGTGEEETRIVVRVSSVHGTVDFLAAGLPAGVEIGAFSRVVANGRGSEYAFTQFFADDVSEAEITRRKAVVSAELQRVRELCEEGQVAP